MIVPACTAWPSPALMPRRWPTLSRPFLTEPPAFLCAIDRPRPYFCVFFGAAALAPAALAPAALAPAAFGRAVVFLSPAPVVSAFAVGAELAARPFVASALAFGLVDFEAFAALAAV